MAAPKHYSLQEAEALLPQIAPRMERALQLHVLVRSASEELAQRGYRVTPALLSGRAEPQEDDTSGQETLERARALYQAMMSEIEVVQDLGAEVKGVEQGLVDFWSWLDGETEVLLCWKLGEPRIQHYHLPDAGFAGRQSIEGHLFTKEPGAPRPSGDPDPASSPSH